ncbi:MAG: hypothetical protein WA699_12685, partial [Pseudolabrys sp.]
MRRREFIKAIAGSAAAWPFAAQGQQGERMRRIDVLLPAPSNDPDYQPWLDAFRHALQELGWIDGRNARIE